MISKGFLSGIFSVVSFILISNLAIPSTFAQCPPDVSGTWVIKFVDITECCSDPSENGLEKGKESIVVTQVGDKISASWVEDETGYPMALTGIVKGKSVYYEVVGTDLDDPGCEEVEHTVGIIDGKQIKGYFSGAHTCDTCRWHGRVRIRIVK